MQRQLWTKLKTIIVTVAIITLSSTPITKAQTAQNDALMNILPQDCVACLRINSFNESLGKLDSYLAGASPVPMSLAMLVNMQLGAMVGDPMLTGIDMNGDFAAFVVMPPEGQQEPLVGILVPVKNYTEFVTRNPNCKKNEDGTTVLASPNSPVSNLLLDPAGDTHALVFPESEKENFSTLQKALGNELKMAKRLSPSQAKEAASTPAWAFVDFAGIYEKYNEDALGMLQMFQGPAMAEAPAGIQDLMNIYFKLLPEILKEFGGGMDSLTISLSPEVSILNLDISLRAKESSKLADIFIENPNAADSYTMAGYLDNNNAVNGLAKTNMPSTKKMYDLMFEIMDKVQAEWPSEGDSDFKSALEKTYEATGNEVAFSFSYTTGTPPFKFHEVVEIKDSKAMLDYMENSTGFVNSIYKSMGLPLDIKYEPNVSTYKESIISTWTIQVAASDDPNTLMMQKGIETVYGEEGFKYYFAQTTDKFYMSMGPDGENALKTLIDQSDSASATGDIKVAMDALADTPYKDFICSVNIIKLWKGLGGMMQSMGQQMGENPAASIFSDLSDAETQSCLVAGGKMSDGSASVRLAVPKQHLIEIIAVGMQMQQKAMLQQSQMSSAASNMTSIGSTPGEDTTKSQPPSPAIETSKDPLSEWIGKSAPELKMVDLDGKVHRISRLKGKKVILDFWATWCPPCKKSIPDLIKMRSDSNASELTIVGLSDEPADKLNPFIKENKINYPIVSYAEDLPDPYGQITALPTLLLIDSKGIIQDVLVGYHEPEDIQTRLSKIN